jgi:hypothetical protein
VGLDRQERGSVVAVRFGSLLEGWQRHHVDSGFVKVRGQLPKSIEMATLSVRRNRPGRSLGLDPVGVAIFLASSGSLFLLIKGVMLLIRFDSGPVTEKRAQLLILGASVALAALGVVTYLRGKRLSGLLIAAPGVAGTALSVGFGGFLPLIALYAVGPIGFSAAVIQAVRPPEDDLEERSLPRERPSAVTAAGVFEILLGSQTILFGMVLVVVGLTTGPDNFIILLIHFVPGVFDVIAGVSILQLRKDARILGLVMASAGLAMALLALAGEATAAGSILALIAVVLRVLVIIWLTQNRSAFVR